MKAKWCRSDFPRGRWNGVRFHRGDSPRGKSLLRKTSKEAMTIKFYEEAHPQVLGFLRLRKRSPFRVILYEEDDEKRTAKACHRLLTLGTRDLVRSQFRSRFLIPIRPQSVTFAHPPEHQNRLYPCAISQAIALHHSPSQSVL